MKLCFIADGNSIHARRWIEYFCKPENEVHILSTTYCVEPVKGAMVHNLPAGRREDTAIDGIGVGESSCSRKLTLKKRESIRIRGLVPRQIRELEQYHIASLIYKVFRWRKKAARVVRELQPDLVHCLRLPIEGWIGGLVGYCPLIMTTFGNDMVYFAQKYSICRWLTTRAMSKTDLYFSDSLRDKYIAEVYGFSPASLTFITPVTGGLKLEGLPIYQKSASAIRAARGKLSIEPDANLLISVRGFKYFYIYTKTLVEGVPKVIEMFPNTIFVLKGNTQSSGYFELRELARRLRVEKYIRFTDRLSVEELVDHFTASDIMLSATLYDGCPISMLEGMAYGLIPVMSVHSPIQEWITDGWNGYLFDPRDPDSIAEVIARALTNKDNFEVIRERNWALLEERADYWKNMKVAEEMYGRVVGER